MLQERGVSYDPDKLDALKELLPEDELVEAGALALEHEETKTTVVPRRWNATKLKGFAKRGAVIRGIIEGARTIEGARRRGCGAQGEGGLICYATLRFHRRGQPRRQSPCQGHRARGLHPKDYA